MRTLLVSDISDDTPVALALTAAGHEVLRCGPAGRHRFPCRAAEGDCPLDATVDVAVVLHDRPSADIGAGEAGVVCAIRDGLPLVVAGNGAHSPFRVRADSVAASVGDVVDACHRAVSARDRRLARTVTAAVGVEATVTVRGDVVDVRLPEGTPEHVAVLAHQALRRAHPRARAVVVGTTGAVT